MKLIEAAPRLGTRFPHLMAETDAALRLTMTHEAIAQAREDIRVLQVLAHSLRTAKMWQDRGVDARTATKALIMATPIRELTDAQLKKRTNYGGSATVRAEINAEILRRYKERATIGVEQSGTSPVDETAEDAAGDLPTGEHGGDYLQK